MKRALLPTVLVVVALLVVGCSLLPGQQAPAQPTSVPQPTQPAVGGDTLPTAVIPTPGAEVGTVAARVNGQAIPMATFQKQFFQFKVALTDQNVDLTTDEGKAALAQVRAQVLNSLIELALIQQAAARMGISISDEQLEAHVQETVASGGGEEKFQEWLAESGITPEEFREQLRAELQTEMVIQQVTGSVPDKAEQVHARHILLASEQDAQAALRRIQAGEDFAKVAREMSQDEITRADGGDLDFFPKGMLSVPKEIEDAAFALQPGQVSGIVRSPHGYHIVQVLERQAGRPLPPDVYQAMKQKAFDDWLQQQRAAAQVEILVPTE
ncbi:MAG: peptidylprolyl isomerase [Anaerolineae bacterium]|nr:peptidylprolyl isomerase [Anaerolineae bacterium]